MYLLRVQIVKQRRSGLEYKLIIKPKFAPNGVVVNLVAYRQPLTLSVSINICSPGASSSSSSSSSEIRGAGAGAGALASAAAPLGSAGRARSLKHFHGQLSH